MSAKHDASPLSVDTDPVCGMTVDPATSRHSFEHGGATFHFCGAGCQGKFATDPHRYLQPEHDRDSVHRYLHLPDASRGPPDRPGQLPDLRHGAGTADDRRRTGGQSGTRRHEPAVLDRPRAHRPSGCAGNGRSFSRHRSSSPDWAGPGKLAAIGPGQPGGALGGRAFLPARLGLAAPAQPEHVHVDRAGDWGGMALQRCRDDRARRLPRRLPQRGHGHCGVLRGRIRHHGARAARAGARIAGPRADRRRDPCIAQSCPENGPPHHC